MRSGASGLVTSTTVLPVAAAMTPAVSTSSIALNGTASTISSAATTASAVGAAVAPVSTTAARSRSEPAGESLRLTACPAWTDRRARADPKFPAPMIAILKAVVVLSVPEALSPQCFSPPGQRHLFTL